MPLLLGLLLVALFIWFGETITTAAGAWLYPGQAQGWRPVGPAKLASWFLLMLISYTLVASLEGRSRLRREEGVDPDRALARALRGSLSGFMT